MRLEGMATDGVDTIPTASDWKGYIRHDIWNGKFYWSDGSAWNEILWGSLADGVVTQNKYANNSITAGKMQDGIITDAKIFSGAAISPSKINFVGSNVIYSETWGKMKRVWNPVTAGRTAAWLLGGHVSPLDNWGNTFLAASGQTSPTTGFDSTRGRYTQYNTGTTTGNNGGSHCASLVIRALNPYWAMRGRLVSTTLQRVFWGLSSDAANSPSASDTYADGKHIAMILARSGDSTFQFCHNNATTPALYENTTISCTDQVIHTWEIFLDETGARAGYAVDNGTIQWFATQVPGSTNSLGMIHEIQTNESGVIKTFDRLNTYIEMDNK